MALTKIKLDSMVTGTLPDANIPDDITITGLSGTNSGDQTTGISDGNILECNANVADNDYLQISGTEVEGRTYAEVRSDLGISDDEIIDWTTDQGSTNIHSGNYTNTTYSEGNSGLVPAEPNPSDTTKFLRSDGGWEVPAYIANTNTTYTAGTNMTLSGTEFSSTDTNTTYANFTDTVAGLVPTPAEDGNTKFLRQDQTWVVPTDTNTTYSQFAGTTAGLVPTSTTGDDTTFLRADGTWVVPTDTNTDTNTTYTAGTNMTLTGTEFSSTDTNTTYSTATSSALGLVKIGYTESGKNYPVELSSSKMYVNVPWTDTNTNTTYSAGTNMTLTGTTFSSTDTNTTYSTATSSVLGLVKIGYTESGKNYPVELSSGKMYVNVPWVDTNTNTTYSAGTNMSLSGTTFSSTDTNTTYSAGTNMSLSGTTFSSTNTTYSAGTGMSLSGTTFNCTVTDTNTTYSAGTNMTLSGTTFSSTTDFVSKANGGTFGGQVRVQVGSAYIDMIPHGSWNHIQGSAAKFYFDKEIRVNSGLIGSYDEDLQLRTAGTTRLTISNSTGTASFTGRLTSQCVGHKYSGGTIANGVTVGVNINGAGGNLSIGHVCAAAMVNSTSHNVTRMWRHTHTQGGNSQTSLISLQDGNISISDAVITQIYNNSGSSGKYVVRYLNIIDYNAVYNND